MAHINLPKMPIGSNVDGYSQRSTIRDWESACIKIISQSTIITTFNFQDLPDSTYFADDFTYREASRSWNRIMDALSRKIR